MTSRPFALRLLVGCILVRLVCAAQPAGAQALPDRPIVLGNGRTTISGDLVATTSCASESGAGDCTVDTGFFNYTDYDLSTIRMIRAGISGEVRASRAVSLLADLRFQNTETPRPYGLYARVRPWERRAIDIQAGLVPPTFGASARRAYANDNLLIGFPLGYQYLTSLRPDALPATADDLLRMRGRGWLSSFPVGNQTPEAGMPLVEVFHWDAGVQVHGAGAWIDGAASVTAGSLANPLFRDDNDGKHVSGRLALRPVPGLLVGVSGSRAPFVTEAAAQASGYPSGDFVQRTAGLDVEYSRGHYLVRVETVLSSFSMPTIGSRLGAAATFVEGRYKLTPALHVAARVDHLGFSTITGSSGPRDWEAPVTRWEAGGGYSLRRNVQVRASFQHNSRPDAGRVRSLNALAFQLQYWF